MVAMSRSKDLTVLQMIADTLKAKGFDGLCNEGCGCTLDDLAPCGMMGDDCAAARKRVCPPDGCPDCIADGDCEWRMEPAL